MQTIVGDEFPRKVIPMIDAARRSIDIIVFDWRWYPNQPGHSVQRFNQAIQRATNRGVAVRAIVNSPDILWRLKQIGVHAKRVANKKIVHCKYINVDNRLAVIGSHNITQSAFHMNMELSVMVQLEPGGGRLTEFFENVWGL